MVKSDGFLTWVDSVVEVTGITLYYRLFFFFMMNFQILNTWLTLIIIIALPDAQDTKLTARTLSFGALCTCLSAPRKVMILLEQAIQYLKTVFEIRTKEIKSNKSFLIIIYIAVYTAYLHTWMEKKERAKKKKITTRSILNL